MRKLIVLIGLFLAACGGNATTSNPDGGSGAPDAGLQCGTGSVHQQLLTAPTDSRVEKKTPTHPAVGPEGLP